ncbi:MAG: hypothetical protein ACFFDB_07970 [Promethearchaeota archaeon]
MISNDFDIDVQKVFNELFKDIPLTNWKKWFDISSKEEYEELTLKNSGLSSVIDIYDRIEKEKTESRELTIGLNNFLDSFQGSKPKILCHSSGTTDSKISALKWFNISDWAVKRYWAPGMQAIFESSGLNSHSSAVIFVPSRLNLDGLKYYKDKKYISLYSSEFSQRVMLSIIKPNSYTFFEYRNSKRLDVIAKILSLEKISTLSAPALTILGWADIEKFQHGLQESMQHVKDDGGPLLDKLKSKVENKGIKKAAIEIQRALSKKLSQTTIVFSISSLSEKDWVLIRKFMNWEKGEEKFINLYVSSETGPFAASITKNGFEFSRSGNLFVFPLILPVIEYKGTLRLISQTETKMGKLLISRINNSKTFINIDIGDIIRIVDQESLPQIEGKILRANFQLKYPIKLTPEIPIPPENKVYVGDLFYFDKFDFYYPRGLINCLNQNCNSDIDSLLLIKEDFEDREKLKLFIPSKGKKDCINLSKNRELLSKCINNENFKTAILNNQIEIITLEKNPIDFLATRKEMLDKVRKGLIAKGILKKWPLYVIRVQ